MSPSSGPGRSRAIRFGRIGFVSDWIRSWGGMWGYKVCIVWNGKGIWIRVCGYGGSDRWNEAWRGRDGGGRSDARDGMGWDGTR